MRQFTFNIVVDLVFSEGFDIATPKLHTFSSELFFVKTETYNIYIYMSLVQATLIWWSFAIFICKCRIMQITLTRKVKHKQIMNVYSYKILDFLTINDWTDFLSVLLYCTKNQLVINIYIYSWLRVVCKSIILKPCQVVVHCTVIWIYYIVVMSFIGLKCIL